MKHKVFISYHHGSDWRYKELLQEFNDRYELFVDRSVNTGAIPDTLPDERIRELIRDRYLRDSTVTLVLVGEETRRRKHIDWEIYSSMIDGPVNKKSGILAIELPEAATGRVHAARSSETSLYPAIHDWTPFTSFEEARTAHPSMPDRILDNLFGTHAGVSVAQWSDVLQRPSLLGQLIHLSHVERAACRYNLSRGMRRANS